MGSSRPTVLDIFCGAGGFARGFLEEGFNIVLGIDSFKPAAMTYKANFPSAIVVADDVKVVDYSMLQDLIDTGSIDIVIGSPPCEPFTSANPRRLRDPLDRLYSDPRGRLVLHFIRILAEIQPKIFIMENVPHIMEGELRKALKAEFKRAGYRKVYFNMLRAEDYNTPSHRLRVFISNVRINPKPSRRRITVKEALKDLPPPDTNSIPNHRVATVSRRMLKRIVRLKWGEAAVRFRGDMGRTLLNYIKLDPNRIAPTVMGSRRFVHPYEHRLLTVREQARLMGFPDTHLFYGGIESQYDQVGEAVPVPLARAIAGFLRKHFF